MVTNFSSQITQGRSFVDLNGAKLHYGYAGGRGYGSHGKDFASFLPFAETHYLIGLDMRGHGLSSSEDPLTFNQLSDDVEEFRKVVLGGRKMVLLGGSFGGFIAQLTAIRYYEGLSHLILRGTAPSYHQEEDAMKNLKERIHKAPNASPEMLTKIFTDTVQNDLEMRLIMFALGPLYSEHYDANAALAGSLNAYPNARSHNALYSPGEKFFDYRDNLSVLSEARLPVLCVAGEMDWICPTNQSWEIKKCIGGNLCWVEIVPDANHGVHLEKPAEVRKAILEFFERSEKLALTR